LFISFSKLACAPEGNCTISNCGLEINELIRVQYAAKLLKKPDQCRAVLSCSHLFWVEDAGGVRDGERCAIHKICHYLSSVLQKTFVCTSTFEASS
jgi:hypothetical protein